MVDCRADDGNGADGGHCVGDADDGYWWWRRRRRTRSWCSRRRQKRRHPTNSGR